MPPACYPWILPTTKMLTPHSFLETEIHLRPFPPGQITPLCRKTAEPGHSKTFSAFRHHSPIPSFSVAKPLYTAGPPPPQSLYQTQTSCRPAAPLQSCLKLHDSVEYCLPQWKYRNPSPAKNCCRRPRLPTPRNNSPLPGIRISVMRPNNT